MIDAEVERPLLRWHGGKYILARWIIQHFPPHQTYVEPYGGAASVLLRKPRSYAEVYNDLDGDAVNLFRVLRDQDQAKKLIEMVRLTPFARDEFVQSYQEAGDPIEQARRLIARSFMGFGSDGHNRNVKTGFRANSSRSGTTPAHDWANYPDAMTAIIERLRGVVIENRPAQIVCQKHDGQNTLHYLDPPYWPETRSKKSRRYESGTGLYHAYTHEMTPEDHLAMLAWAKKLNGMVVISGYHCAEYDAALKGWSRFDKAALADGARERIEVLWINPQTASRLNAKLI